jgi:hypothetical protein
MATEAIAENAPTGILNTLRQRRRAPLSLVVCLFVGNGLIWFGVGILVGDAL